MGRLLEMQSLYHARHHRFYGDVSYFVFISGGIARRYACAPFALDCRVRRFERAEQIGFVVDIGNDKAVASTTGKFLIGKELQGGGVLVPAAVLLGLALTGRLVEENYLVNIRHDNYRHTADCRECNVGRQAAAVNPADGLNSGEYLYLFVPYMQKKSRLNTRSISPAQILQTQTEDYISSLRGLLLSTFVRSFSSV